jgi:hypothetical protein
VAGADTEAANRVFISHSKNPAILDQLKTVLEFGRFVPVVAEEEEATAIPVPEKVLTSMRRCGSAVINVSADEAERHEDGRYGINQNVLIEIGAASSWSTNASNCRPTCRVSIDPNTKAMSWAGPKA